MNESKTFDLIKEQISKNSIVLYMKGTVDFPQCGFSAMVVGILQALGSKQLKKTNYNQLNTKVIKK